MTRHGVKTVQELFRDIPHTLKNIEPHQRVFGLCEDSRKIRKGDIFIALKGTNYDGHSFIKESLEKGASAICAQYENENSSGAGYILVKDTSSIIHVLAGRFFDYPARSLKVIGITGTNGKTTTAHLVHSILKSNRRTPSLIGTIHHMVNEDIVAAHNTTPGTLELNSLFYAMKEAGSDAVVMEVSSHALAQSRVDAINFSIACLTNITEDHLDYHGDMEAYVAAKKRLFETLDKKATAILNSDDDYYKIFKNITEANVMRYGIAKEAEFKASHIESDGNGSRFFLETPNGTIRIKTSLIGRHNVYNILAASAIAFATDVDLNTFGRAIDNFSSVPGRMEPVEKGQCFRVFIDYAHTADALENVLSILRRITPGKLVAVFGCGGDRDRTKRPKMGSVASLYSDYVILTSDNPRHENPDEIISEIERGFKKGFVAYKRIPDRRKAIEEALTDREPTDTVLIAGKGHENYQLIGGQAFAFNDRKVTEEILGYVYS